VKGKNDSRNIKLHENYQKQAAWRVLLCSEIHTIKKGTPNPW